MKGSALLALALLGACQHGESAPRTITLGSQTMTLPADHATLPASAEIVTVNCSACHSAEMILTQPRLDAAKWQAEVTKMRGVYKASIDPKDDATIVAALVTLQE